MPNQEKPQDFELIELLIREVGLNVGANPSTSTQQGSDFESFKTRFQSYIDQIPSYLHSVGKEGFFPHFFLGSFSTLADTEIAKKLNIEKIYFSFDSSKTLKVAVIKKGEIKSPEDAADKVKLFVIAESDSTRKKFSYGELDKVLGNTKVASNNLIRQARDGDKLGIQLVEITKEKDTNGKTTGISVDVRSNKLDKDTSITYEFKEIKKGLWSNPESDISNLTNSDKKEVKKSFDKILKKVGGIHLKYKDSLIYAKEAREASHHGFIAGALVNFRYRHNLRVYLEQFAGRGYADIVLVPRGKDRSLNATPIIIELKAATKAELKEGKIGEKSGTTPAAALKQAEDYTKGFQPNVMRVLTTADDILCVGVNLDHPSPISDIVAKSRDQKIIPLFNDMLGSIDERNSGKIDEGELKKQIQNNIERVYHTFPGTGEKGDNHYFSRFLLGQSLLLNEVKDLKTSFEKHIFVYEENVPTEVRLESKGRGIPQRQAAKKADEKLAESSRLDESHAVVTMVFVPESDKKSAYVMNIVESDGKAEILKKGIPLNKLEQKIGNRKIVELNLNFNIKEQKSDFKKYFSVEVNEPIFLGEYNGKKSDKFKGNFKNVPYPKDFKKTFDEVLVSQLAPSQDQSSSIGKYKKLFGKVGEAMLPFKGLIEKEAHTQAVLHGAFDHYSDIKLGEPQQEDRALILTEFQTGRGKRIDMLVHGIKFANQANSAKEYDPVGLEVKGPREGKTADALITEANDQITKEYTKGVTYKTLTDGNKVAFMGIVFDKGANNANSLILVSKDEFTPVKVVHSSIFSFSQCATRKRRDIGIPCIDSLDEEKITEEGKKQLIKELFNADKVVEKVKNIEFYDQLFKLSQQISEGEIIDKNVEEAFVAKIKDIDLNSIDPEIKDIVKEMKDNIENKEEIKNILRRSGVAEKIGKVAEGAGLAFTAFLVGKHIANGDVEGLGYDALNLWVMPKIGEKISGKILELGTKLDSQMLKGFAPVMGRAIGNFAAFLGLAESIKARQNATDPVDIKIADLNIATNSIFIAADVPAVVTETMSVAGLETGVIGEFAGPVGAGISVAAIIISQFAEVKLEVEKLEEHINLTDQEKHDFYWDFFLGKKIPHYIEDNMEVKEIYKQYISKIVDKFKNDHSRIAISLPPISVKKVVYATNNQLRQKKRGVVDDIDNQMKHLFDACRIRTQVVGREFDFNFTAIMSSSNTRYTGHYSRIVPHSLENYNIVCGPYGDNIKEQEVSREIWHKLPSEALCDDSSPHKDKVLSTVKEKWSLQEYPPHCQNVVMYENDSLHKYKTDMYYIKSLYTDIRVSEEDSLNVIFFGTHVSISDLSKRGSDKVENRYYFMSLLESCNVQKSGNNFFYIEDDRLSCNLGINRQKNIVIVKGDFTDSKNIQSVVGSNGVNHIETSHAGYVDGKGGNDTITAKNFTTIKGYFGDSIYGKGLVLLPINFNDIGNVTHANNITNIYNKSGDFISVEKQTLVKTADDLFVTPTKVDINGIVTNLQVTKSVGSNVILDDELDSLRKIDNSNFNITKQLSTTNYHSTIGSASNHIFYPDKEHHNFYWEAPSDISHLYLFDERNANITIAKANGILDFSQLNSTLNDMPFIENDKGEIKINKNGLNVTLLPGYKDITVTFDGEEYYKFQDGELERDYCSHSLKIDGRFSVNGTDLLNHYNCFTFDSDKVLFLKFNNDSLLLSDKEALSISNYYSLVHENWDLSIKLNDNIIEPEEFRERADNPSSFRYYKPDEQGLQIYHNQPVNKNDIGLIDLRDKSILDFNMKVINDSLLLLREGAVLVKVENWNTYQSAREMIFAFNDAIISNSKRIVSYCNSEDIIVEFSKEKAVILTKQVFDAVVQSNIDIAKDLVKKIENIDTRGNYELTLLYVAIRENRLDVVKLLFDRKYVSVEGRDAYYHTPLHWAIQKDRLGIAKFLLDQGADIEAKDQYGWTSIYYAIYKDNFDILKFLIDNGADIEAKTINNETPLYMTVEDNNKFKMFRLLLDKGANIEAKSKDDWTPLHYAAYKDNLDVCKLLLEKGASVEAKNINDETPLHVAAENNNRSKVTVELLLDKGANIEAKSKNGWTPLHYAAYKDNLDVCKLLLERGASIEAKTNDDGTPLNIANYTKHFDVVEYLEKFKEEMERPVQRKRRHHHGDHNTHNLSRKPLSTDSSNQLEIASSSGIRTSSWINSCIAWMKDSIGGFFTSNSYANGKNRVNEIGYSTNYEKQQTFNHKPQMTVLGIGDKYLAQADVNGTVLLADVLLAKRGKRQIYTSSMDQGLSQSQTLSCMLNIRQMFEKAVKEAALKSGISERRLNIDFAEIEKMEKEINNKIARGRFDEISQILKSYAEKACPRTENGSAGMLSPKKFNKFMAEFNNLSLDQSIQQILYNSKNNVLEDNNVQKQQRSSNLENKKPKSYLDNIATQGYLTQVRDVI
ncbi:ankyrin repeat domain-containing protein [Candidatus Mesenet endosymbiont of Agriotes lineatus]|uniref:ankyrin repeat domain-containing protein n=1 Tax=Candidatus Mesenet endosymbiont of Agriotes lineatus TaxID=3077948 RepID=UPI0030D1827A